MSRRWLPDNRPISCFAGKGFSRRMQFTLSGRLIEMPKRSGGPNKSEAIRSYLEAHPEAKPKEIVEALKAQGIDVTPAFVSTIKSKSGVGGGGGRKKRARRKTAAAAPQAAPAAARAPRGGAAESETVSVASLVKAKQLIDDAGGIEKAKAALAALEKISR